MKFVPQKDEFPLTPGICILGHQLASGVVLECYYTRE